MSGDDLHWTGNTGVAGLGGQNEVSSYMLTLRAPGLWRGDVQRAIRRVWRENSGLEIQT